MRKSDKKLDNQLRQGLTRVCEAALKDIDGFEWLTHTVNYDRFPQSLKIICVFDSNENLTRYQQSADSQLLASLISQAIDISSLKIKNLNQHLVYDSEEDCERQHQGNWALRLSHTTRLH